MTRIKFNRQMIGKPIPASWAFWCRVYTIIGATLITAVKTAPFIDTGSVLQQSIEWFFSSSIAVANLLLPMIGVETDQKYIPADKVTGMETEKKP